MVVVFSSNTNARAPRTGTRVGLLFDVAPSPSLTEEQQARIAHRLAGYVDGEAHPISLDQDGWELRDYQEMAAESFWAGGSGVVVLPVTR